MAAAVVAGNDHLAAYAGRYNDRVSVVPSTVSLREYQERPQPDPDRMPVVGWTGSHSSVPYLSLVRGPLQELRKRRPFRLLIVGVEHFEIAGVDVECRPWSAASEVRDLWDMDVGIMPLPDEPWARGKCGMKAIQYMGIGIPAVVSPVGANREIVGDAITGFHAATGAEWVDRLDRLLADADLRRRLGAAARESVRLRYSAEASPRVAEVSAESRFVTDIVSVIVAFVVMSASTRPCSASREPCPARKARPWPAWRLHPLPALRAAAFPRRQRQRDHVRDHVLGDSATYDDGLAPGASSGWSEPAQPYYWGR
jgi:hypothetical protein